jgi:hypothetical protein
LVDPFFGFNPNNVQLFVVPKFTSCTFIRIRRLFISPNKLFSDTAPSPRSDMALRTSLPLRPLLGARAFHTAPVLRQAPSVPPSAPKTAAELGFRGNKDRTRTLDPALTKPLKVTDSSYLHLPDESQAGGSGPREQQLVSFSSASTHNHIISNASLVRGMILTVLSFIYRAGKIR